MLVRTAAAKSRNASRWVLIVVSALSFIATVVPRGVAALPRQVTPSESSPVYVGSLGTDDELFWQGGFVEDSLNPDGLFGLTDDTCHEPTVECFDYTLGVTEQADRLRVAISDASVNEFFAMYLYDPQGRPIERRVSVWSGETFVMDPVVGTWTMRVVADLAEDATFYMRAKLEDLDDPKPGEGRKPRDLLPNLRLTPPFEFTFTGPVTLVGPVIEVRGDSPISCTAAETVAVERPARCLRFSLGPQNVGAGPLELIYTVGSNPTEAVPIEQVVHRDDGSKWRRPAGSAQYHHSHAHYHHVGFGTLELFRVDDLDRGDIEKVGTGPKLGFCIAQYMIVDWESFDQAPVTRSSTCESRLDTPTQEAEMWLTPGWSDIYSWSLDYNYVEFGTNGDGLYLVRSTTDPGNDVLESNEKDNTGYALVRISGNDIELLERGYGQGPWDPHTIIEDDSRVYDIADTRWLPFSDVM